MNAPLVTVLTAVRNGARFLEATIESIQKKHKEFSDRLMEEEIKLSK